MEIFFKFSQIFANNFTNLQNLNNLPNVDKKFDKYFSEKFQK